MTLQRLALVLVSGGAVTVWLAVVIWCVVDVFCEPLEPWNWFSLLIITAYGFSPMLSIIKNLKEALR